jgi:hypothetical protein
MDSRLLQLTALSFFLACLVTGPTYAQENPAADETHFSVQRTTQTDHLDTETASVSHDFKFNNGADSIGPLMQYSRFDQKSVGSADLFRPGIDGNFKLNNQYAIAGTASVDEIMAAGATDHLVPTYNVYGTYTPNDSFRLDLGSNRNTFDNMTSLRRAIAATYFGGDVSYLPNNTWRLTARGNEGLYNDGNERQLLQLETEKQVLSVPFISIGARVTGIHFHQTLNNGYFDPLRYGSAEGLIRMRTALTKALTLELGASGGYEGTSPGNGARATYDPSAKLSYAVSKNLSLDGTAEYYKSRLASDSGFSQLILGLALNYSWQK